MDDFKTERLMANFKPGTEVVIQVWRERCDIPYEEVLRWPEFPRKTPPPIPDGWTGDPLWHQGMLIAREGTQCDQLWYRLTQRPAP